MARLFPKRLATAFLTLTLGGALLGCILDRNDHLSFGLALWWAVQTVTAIGYGDVVPLHDAGRVVAGAMMVFGIAFTSLVTAGVTSAATTGTAAASQQARRAQRAHDTEVIQEAIGEMRTTIADLDRRLDWLETRRP
jgi:voltage-gated potassium channel Kch